jgi:hypothetical protein
VRRLGVDQAQAEQGEVLGRDLRAAGHQHPARPGDLAAVRERHRQRAEGVPVGAEQGVVQAAPPGGLSFEVGELVDRLRQRQPPHPERTQLRPPFQPGRQQPRQDLADRPHDLRVGALQQHRVTRTQRGTRARGGAGQRGVGRGCLGGREEGDVGQPLQDRPPQPAVQLALAQRTRDQAQIADVAAAFAQQRRVHLGGLLDQEVGQRTGRDMTTRRVQREGRDEQRGDAERLVGGRRRMHDRADGRDGGRLGQPVALGRLLGGDGPGDGPVRAVPLLDRTVAQQLRRDLAGRRGHLPAALAGLVGHHHDRRTREVVRGLLDPAGQGAQQVAVALHRHLDQAGEGQQQRVVDLVEQTAGQVLGCGVAQRQHDDGVVALRGGALGGQRQPQQRDVAVAAAQLLGEARLLGGQAPGLRERPADPARTAQHGRLVRHREHRREPDTEPPDRRPRGRGPGGRRAVLALGRGPQRGERFDALGVQRGAGVRGAEHALAQRQPQPPRHPRPRGRVGGVLRELDHQAVPVAAEGQLLLGIRVLTEPRGGRGPCLQHPPPQTGCPELVHRVL